MAAMMVVNVAPAFAAQPHPYPWWKDGVKGTNPNETINCTWGYGTGSGKLPCY